MEIIRKPFQGLSNVIRFNWHFYLSALGFIAVMAIASLITRGLLSTCLSLFIFLGLLVMIISLLVSFYVYDLSGLYTLTWLDSVVLGSPARIVNIHAGFDETSALLHQRYPDSQLIVYDFYDPNSHTEVSIERARAAYPPYTDTLTVQTSYLPLSDQYVDIIFVILSAHEIRNDRERAIFFKELKRVLKPSGKIIVVEHLRDLPNFAAYTIGAFHFLPRHTWSETFASAGLQMSKEIKITPFISTFILN